MNFKPPMKGLPIAMRRDLKTALDDALIIVIVLGVMAGLIALYVNCPAIVRNLAEEFVPRSPDGAIFWTQ